MKSHYENLTVSHTYNSWFQINEDGSWNVFSSSSFTEKGVERVIASSNGLVTRHLTIGLDSMLETIEFPAGITNLDASLSDMNRDTFTL